MSLYNFSDQIVFKILRDIEHGYLEITKYNGELLKFGNPNSSLKSVLKILFRRTEEILERNLIYKFLL